MFVEERLKKIVEIAHKEGKVIVKELSGKFGISEDMIRKDLQKLEKNGQLKRTYGGAIPHRRVENNENVTSRMLCSINEKNRIATKAIEQIEDGDVIFLDISSTNYAVAEKLIDCKKNLTIITNMNRIALLFNENSDVEIILVGGKYNKKLSGMVGSYTDNEIKKYKISKAFIGVGGVDLERDFLSNFNIDEANTKRTIIDNSKVTYLVTLTEKFNIDGNYKFSSFKDIEYIITEKMPDDNIVKKLLELDVRIIC